MQDEVWLTAAAGSRMTAMLHDAGVSVTATQTTAAQTATFLREGPALAVVLFLADAVAAAVLAAAGAVVGLHLSARRRTYELAALRAAGASRRDLSRAIRLEQLLTLGFGIVLGVATGWASALLALPSVPELVDPPAAPSLLFVPPVGPVLVPLVVGVLLIAVSAEISRAALLRRMRTDALREGPS